MLTTRILLASDGSEEAARAARTVIEVSEKLGAELHLVYVGRMPSAFYESPGVWALDPELQSKMEERMASRGHHEAPRGVTAKMATITSIGAHYGGGRT